AGGAVARWGLARGEVIKYTNAVWELYFTFWPGPAWSGQPSPNFQFRLICALAAVLRCSSTVQEFFSMTGQSTLRGDQEDAVLIERPFLRSMQVIDISLINGKAERGDVPGNALGAEQNIIGERTDLIELTSGFHREPPMAFHDG